MHRQSCPLSEAPDLHSQLPTGAPNPTHPESSYSLFPPSFPPKSETWVSASTPASHSFIQQCLQSAYCVPGTVLSAWDTAMNRTNKPCPVALMFSSQRQAPCFVDSPCKSLNSSLCPAPQLQPFQRSPKSTLALSNLFAQLPEIFLKSKSEHTIAST